jgi:hypothetical protein
MVVGYRRKITRSGMPDSGRRRVSALASRQPKSGVAEQSGLISSP